MSSYFWPQSVVNGTQTRTRQPPPQFLTAFDLQPGVGLSACPTFLARTVCVTASICLRGAPLTFIFLICSVTTYGRLDLPTICPGTHSQVLWLLTYKHVHSRTRTYTHPDTRTCPINSRHIPLIKPVMFTEVEFASQFHYFTFNRASKLLVNMLMCFFVDVTLCDRAIYFLVHQSAALLNCSECVHLMNCKQKKGAFTWQWMQHLNALKDSFTEIFLLATSFRCCCVCGIS